MSRYRYRLSFGKRGDLRWISHRDLIRTLERALRRADLRLGMSQGFHPKPRFSFPLALALGLEGHAEWMDLELQDDLSAEVVTQRLQAELPDGLSITHACRLAMSDPKLAVTHAVYQVAVPPELQPALAQSISRMQSQASCLVEKQPDKPPVDVCAGLVDLRVENDQLVIVQDVNAAAGAGPRQILRALGLPDAERQGYVIARSAVLLSAGATARTAADGKTT